MEQSLDKKPYLRETLTNFLNKNKRKFILFAILILITLTIFYISNENKKRKNNLIAEKYVKAGLLLSKNQNKEAKEYYENIILSNNEFYSLLSLNILLEKKLIKDDQKILNYFSQLEKKSSTSELLDLILFKKALFLIKNNDFKSGEKKIHNDRSEDWKVTLVDTGEASMTGGRLKRIEKFLQNEDHFLLTYGDGLSDVNIDKLIKNHMKHNKICSITAVHPPGRFGALKIGKIGLVTSFKEKPSGDGASINGGFFVASIKIFDYLTDDNTVLEEEPLKNLAKDKQLVAFVHNGFWQAMDTLRDKILLEKIWSSGSAPWKV